MPEQIFIAANVIYPEARNQVRGQLLTRTMSSYDKSSSYEQCSQRGHCWVYQQAKNESRNQMPSAIIFGKHQGLGKICCQYY
jgi:hypothetical protein